ncbi:MAG: VOC family protein [Candidatus Dojkabacteria bacterium]
MKIDAVAVTSSDMEKTLMFYTLLGFKFNKTAGEHVEPKTPNGSSRLMIDKKDFIKQLTGETPEPGSGSAFAINYDTSDEVNSIASKLTESGFKVVQQPYDAPWQQRYCIVQDPDGYKVDLYSNL